jgi:hypothetical protein
MNFKEFLSKEKDRLDISIQSADKYLTTEGKIEKFLMSEVYVEHKTDGVKLNVIKKNDNGNIDDYIFAYKGNILYKTEYDYQPNIRVKSESIGASQFKTVFQHFAKLGENDIPKGTELFIEFLMSKHTLSSNYSTKHKMVLIGYSESTYVEKFGKLKTKNTGMKTAKRNEFAKQLKIHIPQLLFCGVLGDKDTFSESIKNSSLKLEFNKQKMSMNWDDYELLLNDIKQLFLGVQSKYGGMEEGVVIYVYE